MTPAAEVPVRLTTQRQAVRAFQHLRWWLLKNHVRSLLSGSRLRLTMILSCSAIFWAGLFGLFLEGFRFLSSYVMLTNQVFAYVFSMFFLSLLIMLVFSTGILLYT